MKKSVILSLVIFFLVLVLIDYAGNEYTNLMLMPFAFIGEMLIVSWLDERTC
jgi:hypothetical protein